MQSKFDVLVKREIKTIVINEKKRKREDEEEVEKQTVKVKEVGKQ